MGKTINRPASSAREPQQAASGEFTPEELAKLNLTPAEVARKKERLSAWIQEKMDEWERLTPAERAQADAEWEMVKASMRQARIDAGEVPCP
jgi:hypothetical protein